jgi:hypothetical protein
MPRLNMHGGLQQDQIHASPDRSPSMNAVELQWGQGLSAERFSRTFGGAGIELDIPR